MNKIINNKWMLIFFIVPFFKPICFQYISGMIIIDEIFVIWKIIAAAIITILFILFAFRKKIIPKSILSVFMFELTILFTTIINKGDIKRALIDMVTIVSFSMLIYLTIRYNYKGFCEIINKVLSLLMIFNLIIMLIYPNGLKAELYTNLENPLYFMTTDNGTSLFILTTMFMNVMYSLINNKKINKFIICSCFFSAIVSKSSTAIIASTLFIIYIIFFYKKNISKIFNPYIMFTTYIGIFFITLSGKAMIFNPIIEWIFNKNLSFTGRDRLWSAAIELIKKEPFIGYGVIENNYINIWGGKFSSHNFILELLLQGGIFSLIVFIYVILRAINNQNRYRNNNISNLLVAILFFMCISILMESTVHSVYLFTIIVLSLELPLIIKKTKRND
ncbi:O-antigen ligase family protein [Clostridium saudiense]|uniref:O-antigen ligase family protein n=1 Tax=Clostridium saudiense TaxID=1414720 RepID=UPI00319E015C